MKALAPMGWRAIGSRVLVLFLGACTTGSGIPRELEVEAPPIPHSNAVHGIDFDRVHLPISGTPVALAHLTQGGMRADHGSHFGFKAIADETVLGISPPGALYLAHGAALNRTTRAGQMTDRSRVELLTNDGGVLRIEERSLHFEPWAITESSAAPPLGTVHTTACHATTDIIALQVWVENSSEQPVEMSVRLRFDCDPDPLRERWSSLEQLECPKYRCSNADPYHAKIEVDGSAHSFRRVGARFSPRNTTTSEALLVTADLGQDDSAWVRTESIRLFSGGAGIFTFFIANGAQEEEARTLLSTFDLTTDAARANICDDQEKYFDGIIRALPVAETPRDEHLQKLAIDALRHARYAPLGSMNTKFGAVAAKPLDMRFNSNDLARIASAVALYDTTETLDYLKLMVAASAKYSGRLPSYFDENLQSSCREICATSEDEIMRKEGTAHPILTWSLASAVALNPGIYAPVDIDPLFQGMVQILAHLEDHRGRVDAFFSATSEESGWGDSPRFAPEEGVEARDVDDLERTAWMARAYLDLSALAGAMMLGSDRDTLLQRGEEIQNTINTAFRDPSVGLYLDRVHKGEDLALSTVHTPASVIPTALGLADDLGAQATTDFILDGNALWGTWQGSDEFMMAVPSVAYHDPGLSVYEDGHRQKGQVWPWQVYMAWRALIFGGAFDQAERLRHRFLEMVAAYADEGLYECYNFLDGAPGFGPQGRGVEGAYAPAIIQHAVTAAAVLRILFRQ